MKELTTLRTDGETVADDYRTAKSPEPVSPAHRPYPGKLFVESTTGSVPVPPLILLKALRLITRREAGERAKKLHGLNQWVENPLLPFNVLR